MGNIMLEAALLLGSAVGYSCINTFWLNRDSDKIKQQRIKKHLNKNKGDK